MKELYIVIERMSNEESVSLNKFIWIQFNMTVLKVLIENPDSVCFRIVSMFPYTIYEDELS